LKVIVSTKAPSRPTWMSLKYSRFESQTKYLHKCREVRLGLG